MYIAFADGIPLRRLCSSIHDANEAVALHQQLGDSEKVECEMVGIEADSELDGGPRIYCVVDEIGPYIILDGPTSFRKDSYATSSAALEASKLASVGFRM